MGWNNRKIIKSSEMKKVLSVTIIFLLAGLCAKAQTFDEWFKQNKTQIKYLIQQIAAYQIFESNLTDGYNISGIGLTFIDTVKTSEYNLHSNYFSSLKVVSPAVTGYSRTRDIISLSSAIVSNLNSLKKIIQTGIMTASDISYLNSVYSNMISRCNNSLDELTNLVTDGMYSMTDDQRINRIDRIYAEVKDKYAFSQSFTSEAALLSAQRQGLTGDIKESLINNGVQ
jgi:hypothetical protein